jgi:hypothetical protein
MTISGTVFLPQFEPVAEHNSWMRLEKTTYLTTTLQGLTTNVLQGVPKDAIYEITLEDLEKDFGTRNLLPHVAVKKTRIDCFENPCKNLPRPLSGLPTAPSTHYPRRT